MRLNIPVAESDVPGFEQTYTSQSMDEQVIVMCSVPVPKKKKFLVIGPNLGNGLRQ